jgi:hypothetical protein
MEEGFEQAILPLFTSPKHTLRIARVQHTDPQTEANSIVDEYLKWYHTFPVPTCDDCTICVFVVNTRHQHKLVPQLRDRFGMGLLCYKLVQSTRDRLVYQTPMEETKTVHTIQVDFHTPSSIQTRARGIDCDLFVFERLPGRFHAMEEQLLSGPLVNTATQQCRQLKQLLA